MRLYHHPDAILHHVPTGHPERPDRITSVMKMLDDDFPELQRQRAPMAQEAQLAAIHDEAYLEALYAMVPSHGLVGIDGDTYLSPESVDIAKKGAGAACAAIDDVMTGASQTAFVAMRPPGHHAEPDRAMGFCLFSNAAIAAAHAQKTYGISRVAVLDFDVHHGNGTQAAFWDRPDCLYASTHQMPLYPGTGHSDETGKGNIFNQPLAAGMDGNDVRTAWQSLLGKLAAAGPELIIISAGFDAHQADPLAGLEMQSSDFYELTSSIMSLAEKTADGRVISLLEGGYDLDALTSSVHCHITAMLGRTLSA